jgi:hypothetical protein
MRQPLFYVTGNDESLVAPVVTRDRALRTSCLPTKPREEGDFSITAEPRAA